MQQGYYKLATFCKISFCWKDGKKTFATETEARASITKTGKYRLSFVGNGKRQDLEAFEI